MSDALILPVARPGAVTHDDAVAGRLHRGVLEVAGRLGALLGTDHEAAAFLGALGERARTGAPRPLRPHPIDRLAGGLELAAALVDVVLLAGAADEHEGLATVLRALHPRGEPAATAGLVAAMAEAGLLPGAPDDEVGARGWARTLLASGPGELFLPEAPVPFPDRTVALPDGLWTALRGDPDWPGNASAVDPELLAAVPAGLRADRADVRAALVACASGIAATVVLDGDGDALGAAARFAALLVGTGAVPEVIDVPCLDAGTARALALGALARGVVPVLVAHSLPDGAAGLDAVPAPAVLAVPGGADLGSTGRPVLGVRIPPPTAAQRRTLWSRLAPGCPDAADAVPSGVPIAEAAEVARDAAAGALLRNSAVHVADLRAALDLRRRTSTPPGVLRTRPAAGWGDLVLPADRLTQLQEAVARVRTRDTVLGRWGFLASRPGREGVRLLFVGPPGTGKTLAAEVLAAAVGRDLLVVDLSRMVSKWIGETEKNLAAAFDAGERGDAVLLFDEADALFGRRTEVGDARDRYANLETAYLLSRLSWFSGIAVLATNLRQNIDQAFARRLEFVVTFDPPEEAERRRLWRTHLPAAAPLADDVDLRGLAALYPVTGALIRNAAVAAAFLAADAGLPITGAHLAWAMRREYAKAGRAFPGPPPGVAAVPPPNPRSARPEESP